MPEAIISTVSDVNPDNVEDTNQSVLIPVTPAAVPVVPAVAVEVGEEYEPTGDVGLDMALAFAGKNGLGASHPAMVAASNGDFSILKATLAAKGATGWEQFVALGEAAFTRSKTDNEAKAAKDQAAVFEAAGGKEAWEAVQQWAGANATPEEKVEINDLLNKGGLAAKGAVQYLMSAYSKAGNVVKEPADVAGNAGRGNGVPSSATGALSPREYGLAVGALNHKLNGRLEGSKEYAALQQRRAAYRG